jgi:hypothetical protein
MLEREESIRSKSPAAVAQELSPAVTAWGSTSAARCEGPSIQTTGRGSLPVVGA